MRRADREVTDVNEIIDIIDHCKVCHIAMMDGESAGDEFCLQL